jgi:hypothetical protein
MIIISVSVFSFSFCLLSIWSSINQYSSASVCQIDFFFSFLLLLLLFIESDWLFIDPLLMDYSYVQFFLCGIITIVDYWNIDCCHPEIDVGLSESVKEKNDDDDLTFIKTTMFLSFSHLARTTVTDGITEQKSPIRWRLHFFLRISREGNLMMVSISIIK